MHKSIIVLFLILLSVVFSAFGEGQHSVLRFNNNGNFKIVQFTDIHYKYQNPASNISVKLIKEVINAEKPDLVVFTGDVIWSKHAQAILDIVFAPLIKKHIPWAYVCGNHDGEVSDMTYREIVDYVSHMPYSLTMPGDRSLEGVGNYILEVKGLKGDKNEALLYFFDSGSYSKLKDIGGYDWFGRKQIDWYRAQSHAYTQENGNQPYPALAFFHIPLFEYSLMTGVKDSKIIGTRGERECNGKLNSGMFTAMRESGDIMATFVGHDHDNDYIGQYDGLYLAYGRYSGGKTVYNNLGKNGCRVINLKKGKREFTTYIRLLGGEKLYPVTYPVTFPLK